MLRLLHRLPDEHPKCVFGYPTSPPEQTNEVKALFFATPDRFQCSAVPCAGAGRYFKHRILSQCLPKVWLRDRFRAQVSLRRLLPSSRPGCTPHRSLSTSMLRLLVGLGRSIRPTMGISHNWMRPSYCFRGATPTDWLSRPITFQSRFHVIWESGVSRLVSGD